MNRGFQVVEVGTERLIGTATYDGTWHTSGPTVVRMVATMTDTHGLSAQDVLDLYESWSNGRIYTKAIEGNHG